MNEFKRFFTWLMSRGKEGSTWVGLATALLASTTVDSAMTQPVAEVMQKDAPSLVAMIAATVGMLLKDKAS